MPPAINHVKGLQTQIAVSDRTIAAYLKTLPGKSTILYTNSSSTLPALRDAATTLKSHITRVSLLVLTSPLSHKAVSDQLREIMTSLSVMMAAHELCTYSKVLRSEVGTLLCTIAVEIRRMLSEIGNVTSGTTGLRDNTLTSTGVLWHSCDGLIELDTLDFGGVALRKAEQYQEQLRDAIRELKEWGEIDDSDPEAGHHNVHDKQHDSDAEEQDDEDDFDGFAAGYNDHLPKEETRMREKLHNTLDLLKKTDILLTALRKRRLSRKIKPDHAERIDHLLDMLETLVSSVDDLASAFYELDEDSVDVVVETIKSQGKSVANGCRTSWETDEPDEFTLWSDKWLELIEMAHDSFKQTKRLAVDRPD